MRPTRLHLLCSAFVLPCVLAIDCQAQDSTDTSNAVEIEALRSLASKTFRETDGSLTTRISVRPVHYRAADGRLLEVDTSVQPLSAESGPWSHACDTNTLATRFGARGARTLAVTEHATIETRVVGLWRAGATGESLLATAAAVAPAVEGASVRYPGIFPGADLQLAVGPASLRQELVLSTAPVPPTVPVADDERLVLREVVTLSPGAALLDANGREVADGQRIDGHLQVRTSGPESIWMTRPFAHDARHDLPELGAFDVRVLDRSERGTTVEVSSSISLAWLLDPAREYPVVLDPDLIQQPDGIVGKDSQIWTPGTTQQLGTSNRILQNWSSSLPTTPDSDGLIEFDLTPIPVGSVVNTATLTVFQNNGGQEPNPLGPFRIDAAWDEMTVTWANAPPYAAAPTDTVPAFAPAPGFHAWDVTPDAQDMVNNPTMNFGWRISTDGPPDADFRIDIRSSDWTTPSERPELAVNYDLGGVDILQVDSPDAIVVAGLGGYTIDMTVQNIGPNQVDITTVALTFTGTADRTSEYTVNPAPGNPTTIASMATEGFSFSIDVSLAATVETITLDGEITVMDSTTMASFMDAGATVTDTWDVVACSAPDCGDCNGDLILTILDALVAAQHAAALITLTGLDFSNCNVQGTLEPFPGAVVDVLDALNLAQAAAGLPVTLTCC